MYIPVKLRIVLLYLFPKDSGDSCQGRHLSVLIVFVALQSSFSHTAENLEKFCISENSVRSYTYYGFFFLAII